MLKFEKKNSKSIKDEEKPKTLSLAAMWDDTDESEASNFLPEGEHEVRLNTIELSTKKDKGTAVFVNYESLEGDNEGKTARQMYKLTDAAGDKGPGFAYLKRDLKLLGYPDVPGAKLEKVLKEITEEQPIVIIKCVKNGDYFNCYLQGTAENPADAKQDDDDKQEKATIEVGSKVKWEEGGKELKGEVQKIKKGVAYIEDSEGDDYEVEMDDLELDEEDDEPQAAEIEKGSKVKWEDSKGKDHTGVVKKIEGDEVTVFDDDSESKVKVDLDDLELDEE